VLPFTKYQIYYDSILFDNYHSTFRHNRKPMIVTIWSMVIVRPDEMGGDDDPPPGQGIFEGAQKLDYKL
jgi:hypothetical protein